MAPITTPSTVPPGEAPPDDTDAPADAPAPLLGVVTAEPDEAPAGDEPADEEAPPTPAPAAPAERIIEEAPLSSEAIERATAMAIARVTPPEALDRDDEDPDADRIEFVQDGIIRVFVGGKRHRIRRPFFRELRDLREAHEDLRADIDDTRDDVLAEADELRLAVHAITEDDPDARATIRNLSKRSRAAGRKLNRVTEDGYDAWWRQVFDKLGVNGDGVPEELPAWTADHDLAMKVLNHWRNVPLGRGPSLTGR